MAHRPLSLASSLPVCAALLIGCASEAPPPAVPSEPPPKPWEGRVLEGPFATVADFCKTLPPGACEERADVIVAFGDTLKPQAAKDGTKARVVTVASNDGKTQKAHLLIERGGELFALPVAQEYDPKDGARRTVVVRSFTLDDSGLFILTYQADTTTGAGDAKRQETTARQAYCRVTGDLPVACALFDTEHVVGTGDSMTTVAEESAEVLVLPRSDGGVSVTVHPQSGAKALQGLAPKGEYRITFP